MKGLKGKISWLLIASMILGQASLTSFADADDDYDDTEYVLINDLFRNAGKSSQGGSAADPGNAPERNEVKWSDVASPSVTTEVMTGDGVTYHAYYANGNDITILASASNTYIVEKSGAHTKLDENPYVYAGATQSNADYDEVNITVQDGAEINTLVGSNRYVGTIDKVNITMLDGTVGAIIANQGTPPTALSSSLNNGGAASYTNRDTYKVGTANINVWGGELQFIAGSYGYTLVNNLNITVNKGEITNPSAIMVGTNGEVGKANITVNGGEIPSVSVGQRVYAKDVTFNLNDGNVSNIYAGSYYPDNEEGEMSSVWIKDKWSLGAVQYGKAKSLKVNIAEGLRYNSVYAGMQLLDSEEKLFNETYKESKDKTTYNTLLSVYSDYFTPSEKSDVTINVGAAPKKADSDEVGQNLLGDAYGALSKKANIVLPKLTVTNGKITHVDGIASGSDTEQYVIPGATVSVKADAPDSDKKFTEWTGDANFDGSETSSEATFTMPAGMGDKGVKALFEEKAFSVNPTELSLDLYSNKHKDTADIEISEFDYASPSVASYDENIVKVTDNSNRTFTVEALKEGETDIVFAAEGTKKHPTVHVTVEDTTPVLTVVNGKIKSVNGEECSETEMKVPGGAVVTLTAANLEDKKFTGWSGIRTEADGTVIMPEANTTVTAVYEDKIFKFADDTEKEVTLTVDQTDTNTEKLPQSYSFKLESDYEDYTVNSNDQAVASVTKNADGTYTVKAVKAGLCKVTASAKKDSEGTIELSIPVTVTDTTKQIEASSGTVQIDISTVEKEEPSQIIEKAKAGGLPLADLPEEQLGELISQIEELQTAAMNAIVNNTAVQTAATSGFDNAGNLEELGVPKGVAVEIYPKQVLKDVTVSLTAKVKTVVDETTGETKEVTEYVPVITSVTFDITPFMKGAGSSAAEKSLAGLTGRFTFRIPIPAGVSATARYVKVDHENDATKSYVPIQEENGDKYADLTVTHFSSFKLDFVDSKPTTPSRGGGGGGSSKTTSSTGKWVQNTTGWWYQYADNTWPAASWLYIGGFANGTQWCHFDAAGYLQTGWFTDTDGQRYYLHPLGDGTRGYMYTGWHEIDGKWYYFTTVKTETNPTGSLLVSTTTPDGYQVGADGARIQ